MTDPVYALPHSRKAATSMVLVATQMACHFGTGLFALSALLMNDSRFFASMAAVANGDAVPSCSLQRFDKAFGRLSAYWPDDDGPAWPEAVARPEPSPLLGHLHTEARARLNHLRDQKLKRDSKGEGDGGNA